MTRNSAPHILVPLDGSESASRAISVAAHLAASLRAQITLLRVVQALRVTSFGPAPDLPSPVVLAERQAHAELCRLAKGLSGVPVTTEVVVGPNSSAEIIGWLRHHPADFVVMAAAQRSALRRLFRPSVPAAVQRSGLAPVIVVPAQEARRHRSTPTLKHAA